MLKATSLRWLVLLAGVFAVGAHAQELPFKQGPVVNVTSIRVQDGQFFEYWHFLESRWRPEMEEAKKQGLILSYQVLEGSPRTPEEPNLYLLVTYPNHAALDTIDARMAAIDKQLFGLTPQKSEQEAGQRAPLRIILGEQQMQELQFRTK